MDPKLKDARMQVASEIGADIGHLTPSDEKRFTGVEVMLVLGGTFLFAFFKGLVSKAGEKVGEHLGEKLGDFISKKIDELLGKDRPTQDRLLEESRHDAEKQIRGAGLSPEQVAAIALSVEKELAKALAAKAPEDVSARIAHKVATEAINSL
jgi:hypothetical protein